MAMDATNPTEPHRPSGSDRHDLHRAFLAWTGDPATADDLAQETLLAAWTSSRQPENPDEWRPWLFGVARNILLRWRREMARHGKRTAPPPESERHFIAASAPDDLDELMTRSDIIALLDAALGRLPAETRQALMLKYIDDLPQAAIADRLGVHEKALEGRLHRGKRAMHRFLVTEKPDSAISLGLVNEPGVWVTTDIWCETCGQQTLVGRRYELGGFRLDCPECRGWAGRGERSHVYSSNDDPMHGPSGSPLHAGSSPKSFRKIVEILHSDRSTISAGLSATATCKHCGTQMAPAVWEPEGLDDARALHVRFDCAACHGYSGVCWIPANHPGDKASLDWWSQGARTKMGQSRFTTFANRRTLVSTWELLAGSGSYRVYRDCESLRVVAIEIDGRLIEGPLDQ